jgi:phosphoenolpyruvate phosphomutase
MNSNVGDEHQLARLPEFTGKIAASRDAVRDPHFVVVARCEALIAGAGIAEALRRADAYREAGADAIFIHSRSSTIDEIAEFATEWAARLPLVVAPTTYSSTPLAEFERLGITGVIWANQNMRAALTAMRRACKSIIEEGPTKVEPWIASLDEVFELMRYEELSADEERYNGNGDGR